MEKQEYKIVGTFGNKRDFGKIIFSSKVSMTEDEINPYVDGIYFGCKQRISKVVIFVFDKNGVEVLNKGLYI